MQSDNPDFDQTSIASLFNDRNHNGHQGALLARMGAVIGAQQALATHAEGAKPALRQALVDLAAISELLADDLPQPKC
jgi:hypothetical protein